MSLAHFLGVPSGSLVFAMFAHIAASRNLPQKSDCHSDSPPPDPRIEGGLPGPLVAREAALGPHPEAPEAFRKRPNPRGASLAAVRAMCDWRPRQAIAGNRAAAATKDL
jgi:hypothetical protein